MTLPKKPELELDQFQRPAVNGDSTRTLVMGGAGTGKTQAMIGRILRLLRKRVSPDDIVVITFTTRTAGAFRERLGNLPPSFAQASRRIFVGTPERLANYLLRQGGAGVVGLPPTYTVWDRSDAMAVVAETWARRPGGEILDQDTMAAMLEWRARNLARHGLAQLPPSAPEWEQIIRHYREEKRRRNAVDVDDLVPLGIRALADPEFALRYRDGNPPLRLLVDGIQDATSADRTFLDMVVGPDGPRFVSWDPNQAIDVGLGCIPEPPWGMGDGEATRRDLLRMDHRASQDIARSTIGVAADEQVAGFFKDDRGPIRPPGALPVIRRVYTDETATEFIRGELRGMRAGGWRWGELAVICRDPADVHLVRTTLEPDSIPCVAWDQTIDPPRGPARRLTALLSSVSNPVDTRNFAVAAFGDRPIRDIVIRQVCEVLDQNVRAMGTDLFQAGQQTHGHYGPGSIVRRRLLTMTNAKEAIDASLRNPDFGLADLVARAGELLGILPDGDAAAEIDGLLRLAEAMPPTVGDTPRLRLARFVDLVNPDLNPVPEADPDRVTIGTVHACRGLQWRGVVFVDGDMPGEGRPQDEENRVRFTGLPGPRAPCSMWP